MQLASLDLLTANMRVVGVQISGVDNPSVPRDSNEAPLYLLVKLRIPQNGMQTERTHINI